MDRTISITPKDKAEIKIGFIISDDEELYDTQYESMINAVFNAGRDNDVSIIKFVAAKRYWAENMDHEINMLFDLMEKFKLDGIVFLGWMFDSYPKYFNSFKNRFMSSTQLFSIGKVFDDIPNVRTDGGIYVKDMLLHLIKVHEYKRIVYVPPFSPDSRLDIYKETLEEFGLYDPQLVLDYTELNNHPGSKRVKAIANILFDNLKMNFDAIFAVYEGDLVELISVFKKRGVSIPDDVAVVCYEDGEHMKFNIPPVTTTYFPFEELGYTACEKLIELLTTGCIEFSTDVPSKISIRESCGCSFNTVNSHEFNKIECDLSFKIGSVEQQKYLFDKITNEFVTLSFDLKKLITTMFQSYHLKSSGPFIYEFSRQLSQIATKNQFNKTETSFFKVFHKNIVSVLGHEDRSSDWVNEIWLKSYLAIRNIDCILLGKEKLESKSSNENLIEITKLVMTAYNIDMVFDILSEKFLQPFSVPSCFVFLFNDAEDKYKNCNLAFQFTNGERKSANRIIENPEEFLLENFRNKSMSLAIQNFIVENNVFGFIVYEIGDRYKQYYYSIAIQMSIALRGIISFIKLEERTAQLKEANADLETSNEQIKNAFDLLTKTQEHLVQSEKMASLGKLVAGVAHEINTPIGVSITAISCQFDRLKSFKEQYNNNKITRSQLDSLLLTLSEISLIISTNLERTSQLVKSFKKVSVDQSGEEKQVVNLRNYINTIVMSLSPDINNTKHKVHISCDSNLEIESYPGAIAQILTNFIQNSLVHAFEKDSEGNITIKIINPDNKIIFIYSDDGKGIPKENLAKIFEPFFTTNRTAGGTGLGLHVVYNIVIQMLGGTITCESELGKGTKFIIELGLHK